MPGRAVITGSVGFLGRAFARRLRAGGWQVTGVDVRPGPGVVTGDITRRAAWVETLAGADLLVHAAGLVGDSGDARAHHEVNVRGTRTVMAAAAEQGVARTLHCSTALVVPTRVDRAVTEDDPVNSTANPYVAAKLAAEHAALAAAASGLPLTVLRPVHVYGPHSTQWTVRPVELMAKNLFALVDGGAGLLTPTFVDDVVEAGVRAATTPAAAGQILHVTGPQAVAASDFFGAYADMMGRSLPSIPRAAIGALTAGAERVLRPLGLRPPMSSRILELVDHPGTWSADRAREILGWAPVTTLGEGMAATELWLRDVGLIARTPPEPDDEDG